MYYPRQIPYLLDKDFKENVKYTEYIIEELDYFCMCMWTMKSKKVSNQKLVNNILPDACIDIVVDFVNHSISFAGFSKETILFPLEQEIDYMGVRLRPSTFYYLFDISADRVMDNKISFDKLEKDISLDEIFSLGHTTERIECLKKYLLKKVIGKGETTFIDVVNELYENPKEQNVIAIAKKFGYTERHLYRLFKINFGVSPKVLLNILRLHLCLTLMLEKNMELVDVANLCGFYDQSHFIKEIKKYTGISPLKIIDNYK